MVREMKEQVQRCINSTEPLYAAVALVNIIVPVPRACMNGATSFAMANAPAHTDDDSWVNIPLLKCTYHNMNHLT